MTANEMLESHDWEEAFKYANNPECVDQDPSPPSNDPFGRSDVAEVICSADGNNEGPDWVGVFLLDDGRYAALRAGCDYTGWDCQAGGSSHVASTLPILARWALTDGERETLGISVDGARS